MTIRATRSLRYIAATLIGAGVIATGVWWASTYFGWIKRTSPSPEATAVIESPDSVPYKVAVFNQDLSVPWSIVFTSANRMLATERSGKIRIIENGQLLPTPLTTFSEVSTGSEEGLMGMALDPGYPQNHHLYVCLAYLDRGTMYDKVVRVTDAPGAERQLLLDKIPSAKNHAGCRLKFGPDGKLYISSGDATDRTIAQDLQSLGGKMLRINNDGSIPKDNPFPNSPVWSYGHRNIQGFDWQPVTGNLVATEHGPSGFDGPLGGDEVNIIHKGANYGWPLVSHERTREGTVAPLLLFTPAVAPAAGVFYRSETLPQFKGNFLFAMLKGEGIYRVIFDKEDSAKVVAHEKLNDINVGRIREIIEGPDGGIYFTSSNRDGRGLLQPGDDKIYRLIPRD